MFYAHIVLAKKGPLARIWLAAHWDKKLTKAHVFETNIEKSVEGIMQPKVKLALRTSGHLLLGVVRIYSRKAKYLLADCNEAFVKIKMAFRPGIVDLPEGHREANVNAITLPEVFHDFDTALPELNDIDIEAQFSINQSRADEITMREDYGSLSLSLQDDGFGDMGFDADTPDLARDCMDPNVDEHLFAVELRKDELQTQKLIPNISHDIGDDIADIDGFGDEFGQPGVGLFEGDMFGEPPLASIRDSNLHPEVNKSDAEEKYSKITSSPTSSSKGSRPPSVLGNQRKMSSSPGFQQQSKDSPQVINQTEVVHPEEINEGEKSEGNIGEGSVEDVQRINHSSLIQNEEESFALAPVDASAYRGITKVKRKRKLIVDEVKNISGEEMKSQLSNTSDIVTTLDLAPPTKRLMYWKETGGVEKLFSLPSRDIPARGLFLNYQRNLVSRLGLLEDFSILGPLDVLALDQIRDCIPAVNAISKRGRKRKQNGDISAVSQAITTFNASEFADPDAVRNIPSSSDGINLETCYTPMAIATTDAFELLHKSDVYPLPEINNLDPMNSLETIPMTPSNLQNDLDLQDDFHHSGLTPHHSGIENIESIPNLPVDQISSILNEAENKPENLQRDADYIEVADKISVTTSHWNKYDFPESVESHTCDEQQENETDEQFEERVLNKRAAQMFISMRSLLHKEDSIFFYEITRGNSRKQAAQKFYSLLVLKKLRICSITQRAPYADIIISKGSMFNDPKL